MSTLEHRVIFTPAWDKRHPDPNKNYGIGPVKIHFIVIGPLGAISFSMSSGWFLPGSINNPTARDVEPSGMDLGYHSPTPVYEDHEPHDCDYVKGGTCYGDGSASIADRYLETLINHGSDGLWKELEAYYHEMFTQQDPTP